MTFISSVLSNQGFTPLPVEVWSPSTDFCGAGRGLSIHHSGKHQRQVPVRKAGQYGGAAHYFRRVGVCRALHDCIVKFFCLRGLVN